MFESFKPNAKVYLGAAEKMGVKPEECALVAAHLSDLKGAKACGFMLFMLSRRWRRKVRSCEWTILRTCILKRGRMDLLLLLGD
jgi:beta-phosphoglucomutase-like phosphatase (HAD superfamily)